jgi:hypothetical protein
MMVVVAATGTRWHVVLLHNKFFFKSLYVYNVGTIFR